MSSTNINLPIFNYISTTAFNTFTVFTITKLMIATITIGTLA